MLRGPRDYHAPPGERQRGAVDRAENRAAPVFQQGLRGVFSAKRRVLHAVFRGFQRGRAAVGMDHDGPQTDASASDLGIGADGHLAAAAEGLEQRALGRHGDSRGFMI